MIEYKISNDLIQEIVNGLITSVWERGSISESVKNQLISKGGKDIEKFFAEKKPTEPEPEPEPKKIIKKPIKKKKRYAKRI